MSVKGGWGAKPLSAKKMYAFVGWGIFFWEFSDFFFNCCFYSSKQTYIFAHMSVKDQGGGRLKALEDMSANNVRFFWTAPSREDANEKVSPPKRQGIPPPLTDMSTKNLGFFTALLSYYQHVLTTRITTSV